MEPYRLACARLASRWSAAALVLGDALVDAAVDFGADPLDQTRRYHVVILGAEVTVRPDRRGDFLIPARVHKLRSILMATLCISLTWY
jgi:hypothetical protein